MIVIRKNVLCGWIRVLVVGLFGSISDRVTGLGHWLLWGLLFDLWLRLLVRIVIVFDQFIKVLVDESDEVLAVVKTEPDKLKAIFCTKFFTRISDHISLLIRVVHFDSYYEEIANVHLQD
jgi:hypothetical protein